MGIPAVAGLADTLPLPAGDRANTGFVGTFSAIGPSPVIPIYGPANVAIWASVNTTLTLTAGSASATVASATGLAIGGAINSAFLPAGCTIKNLVSTTVTLGFPTYTYYGNATVGSNLITGLASTQWLLGATITGPGIPNGTTVTKIVTAAVAATSNQPYGSPAQPGTIQISNNVTTASVLSAPVAFNFLLAANIVPAATDTAALFTGAGTTFSATVQLERSFDGGNTWVVCNVGGSGTLAQYTAGTPVSAAFAEPELGVLYRLNCIAYTSGTINYRVTTTGAAAMSLAINQLS
jgi:hypothetical protein